MEITTHGSQHKFDRGRIVAGFFAHTGIARLARYWRPSDACVLTFHGVRDGSDDDQLLDLDQHVTLDLFREACAHLASHYTVLPLREIVESRAAGKSLPARAVAITFDDGYESNYRLAYPVLKSMGLPATIFATAGYVDGRHAMWFHRAEMAMARTKAAFLELEPGFRLDLNDRSHALGAACSYLKTLPDDEMRVKLVAMEAALGVAEEAGLNLPPSLRPMTWAMAREMQASGLIEFGGHTDTHPILARCLEERQAREIRRSRERLAAELGPPPRLFAFTNGKQGDYTPATQRLLKEEGFTAAFTMQEAFLLPSHDPLELPRYGCPSSRTYLEAVVSGSMARLQSLRKNLGLLHAA